MNESEQMLVNELRRIEGAVDKRKKVLESLSEQKNLKVFNRRYVIDLPLTPLRKEIIRETGTAYLSDQAVTRSFVIDRDCSYFYCKEIIYTPSTVGSLLDENAQPVAEGRFSLANTNYFWFNWEVRDTYSDRSWQNLPVPDLAMGSGKTSGLILGRPAVLPAGTEILTTIYPFPNSFSWGPQENPFGQTAQFEPTSFTVQVSFVGFEVL